MFLKILTSPSVQDVRSRNGARPCSKKILARLPSMRSVREMELDRVFENIGSLPPLKSVREKDVGCVFKKDWLRLPSMRSVREMKLGRVFK